MKFGKTDKDPSNIDFELPEVRALHKPDKTSEIKLYTGQPVWSSKGNVGKIYPKGTKAADYLEVYSRQFNSIELNATYYKIPSLEQVMRWASKVPDDFLFCPKVPQFISQRKMLHEKTDALDEFMRHIYEFGNNLGTTFLQLPPHFGPDNTSDLKKFIDQWSSDLPLSVEFRHPDWFLKPADFENITSFFHEKNIGTVISDTGGRRDVVHMLSSNDEIMIRFKGYAPHPSDQERIDQWCKSLKHWINLGIKRIYFFVHQEDESLGISLVIQLCLNLLEKENIKTRFPKLMTEQFNLF